jgi:chromosome segregation ATPase
MNISNGPVRLRDWQPEGDDHNFLHSNIGDLYMRKPAMTPGAFPHRGTAAPFRVAIGLALAAGAGTMLWGTHSFAFASEFDRNAARETPMTLEDRVAALTAELAQVRAETAKLRESQGDTSEELSHMRASLANAEIGLGALRTTIDENEARRPDMAAQIQSNLTQLKDETLRLRMAQDDTATEIGSLRAGVANSEIRVDSLRATTGEIHQQIERIEAARDATGSIARSH